MITFTETFLGITMSHQGKVGWKGYSKIAGAVHQIKVYNISNKRIAYREGQSSYEQTTTPSSVLYGKEPDVITIEGPLCYIDPSMTSVNNLLSTTSQHPVNTLYNVFIPCCVLYAESTTSPDVHDKYWIVDTFNIKRSMQKRGIIIFELVLLRWYNLSILGL